MSSTIASSILRRFSAWTARSPASPTAGIARSSVIRVTPPTSAATSAPCAAVNASPIKRTERGQRVQQRRTDRRRVEAQSREDRGGPERAVDDRLAVAGERIAGRGAKCLPRRRDAAHCVVAIRGTQAVEPRGDCERRIENRRSVQDGNHRSIIRASPRVADARRRARLQPWRSAVRIWVPARSAKAAIVNVGGDVEIVGNAAEPTMYRFG